MQSLSVHRRVSASIDSVRTSPVDHRPRPALYGGRGHPVGSWLRVLRFFFSHGTPTTRRIARHLAWRFRLTRKLPEMCAHYPNGTRFRVPSGDAMYGMVFTHGEYEPGNTAVIEGLLRKGDFAVDVGANHGWFSLTMGQIVGDAGRVWAYEPTPPIYNDLLRNLTANASLPIEPRPRGLSNKLEVAEIHLFRGLPHGHASQSSLDRSDYDSFSADLVTLDSELDDAPASPVLVKVDVEGAELSVVQGAAAQIQRSPPIWIFEVNWDTSGAFGYQPYEIVEEVAKWASYSIFRVVGGNLRPEDDPQVAPQDSTWVCVPESLMDRAQTLIEGHSPDAAIQRYYGARQI